MNLKINKENPLKVRYFKSVSWPGIYSFVPNKHANYITKLEYFRNPLLVQQGNWFQDLNIGDIYGQAKCMIELKDFKELTRKDGFLILKNLNKVSKWKSCWKDS